MLLLSCSEVKGDLAGQGELPDRQILDRGRTQLGGNKNLLPEVKVNTTTNVTARERKDGFIQIPDISTAQPK